MIIARVLVENLRIREHFENLNVDVTVCIPVL